MELLPTTSSETGRNIPRRLLHTRKLCTQDSPLFLCIKCNRIALGSFPFVISKPSLALVGSLCVASTIVHISRSSLSFEREKGKVHQSCHTNFSALTMILSPPACSFSKAQTCASATSRTSTQPCPGFVRGSSSSKFAFDYDIIPEITGGRGSEVGVGVDAKPEDERRVKHSYIHGSWDLWSL
jgi:hypothetical protein